MWNRRSLVSLARESSCLSLQQFTRPAGQRLELLAQALPHLFASRMEVRPPLPQRATPAAPEDCDPKVAAERPALFAHLAALASIAPASEGSEAS